MLKYEGYVDWIRSMRASGKCSACFGGSQRTGIKGYKHVDAGIMKDHHNAPTSAAVVGINLWFCFRSRKGLEGISLNVAQMSKWTFWIRDETGSVLVVKGQSHCELRSLPFFCMRYLSTTLRKCLYIWYKHPNQVLDDLSMNWLNFDDQKEFDLIKLLSMPRGDVITPGT